MDTRQPIIVKRIKKVSGHHGGAWKVAFADFATAMMAFFMVLWLTAFTTPEERQSIEGYFKDPIGFIEGGSPSVIQLEGSAAITETSSADQSDHRLKIDEEKIEELADTLEQRRMQELLQELQKQIDQSPTLREFKDQLLLDITDEGLRIQIVDRSRRPMFDSGRSELKYYSEDLLFELAKPLARVPNRISITGHTDATPLAGRAGYSNWELSAERANAARRALVDGGVPEYQMARVVGLADSVLFDQSDPAAPVNRRIAIIVLNQKAAADIQKNAGSAARPGAAEAIQSLQQGDWMDNVKEVKPDEVRW
ncbi:MAG: flagellar motor protein MotB [Gammaproteobacteria bacterium]|nr:flagellar motor protein MotB [Gammaproteobacteria bacterium]